MTEIICVPLIVSLTYALIELYKKFISKQNETLNRIIPLIGLGLGAVAGIVCFYAVPELIVAHNLFSAIIVGAASGLSATGCNQIFKQLKKYGITVSVPNQSTPTEQTENQPDKNSKSSEIFKLEKSTQSEQESASNEQSKINQTDENNNSNDNAPSKQESEK